MSVREAQPEYQALHAMQLRALSLTDGAANRLSDDSLLEIFHAYRELLLDDTDLANVWWLRTLTHVCRRWRLLAISSPLLWTHIIADTPRIVDLFLKRSGTLPLDVVVRIRRNENEAVTEDKLECIWMCSRRTRSLKLLIPAIMPDCVVDAPAHSFPQLVKLDVARIDDGGLEPALPPFLAFLDYFPQLEDLRLLGFCLSSMLSLLHNCLKRLELGPTRADLTFEELFDALAVLDEGTLEAFSLSQCIPDAVDVYADIEEDDDRDDPMDLPSLPESVSLPRLKSLNISSAAANCAAILRHLLAPAIQTITLRMECRDEDYEFEDHISKGYLSLALVAAGNAVSSSPTPGTVADILSLNLAWGGPSEGPVSVLAWTRPLPPSTFYSLLAVQPEEVRPSSIPAPSIQATFTEFSANYIMTSLRSGLELRNLTMLSLTETSPPYNESDLLDVHKLFPLFCQVPLVQTLSISSYLAQDLAPTLSRSATRQRGRILPLLKALNIGPSVLDYERDPHCRPSFSSLRELIDCLYARAAGGCGLDVLRMPHYFVDNLRPNQVQKLKSCAATVYLSQYPDSDVVWKATGQH